MDKVKSSNKKILVVEDEKPYARALLLKLQKEGFEVSNAYDGEEAIALLKDSVFDLILLDLVIPKFDGFKVLEKIRNMDLKSVVIVLSNLTQAQDKERVEALEVNDFIEKSNVSISDVIEIVKKKIM